MKSWFSQEESEFASRGKSRSKKVKTKGIRNRENIVKEENKRQKKSAVLSYWVTPIVSWKIMILLVSKSWSLVINKVNYQKLIWYLKPYASSFDLFEISLWSLGVLLRTECKAQSENQPWIVPVTRIWLSIRDNLDHDVEPSNFQQNAVSQRLILKIKANTICNSN